MQVAKTNIRKMATRVCEACFVPFYGSQFEKFCKNENCIELRKANASPREVFIDKDVENRIVSKKIVTRILRTQHKVVKLKCKAKNHDGKLCGRSFTIIVEVKRSVYPKFCEEHRNAHKRERYKLQRS